ILTAPIQHSAAAHSPERFRFSESQNGSTVLCARIVQRKTASHFCWKCFLSAHCPTQNRFALSLEMLSIRALSNAKPLRTFAGNAFFPRIIQRKTASHFCWKCLAHDPRGFELTFGIRQAIRAIVPYQGPGFFHNIRPSTHGIARGHQNETRDAEGQRCEVAAGRKIGRNLLQISILEASDGYVRRELALILRETEPLADSFNLRLKGCKIGRCGHSRPE